MDMWVISLKSEFGVVFLCPFLLGYRTVGPSDDPWMMSRVILFNQHKGVWKLYYETIQIVPN